jgi:hypothetical protein
MIHANDQEPCTCVLLGADDALNVKLLRAALRNPPPRLAVGVATPQAASFIRIANDAAGAPEAFVAMSRGTALPQGPQVVILDGSGPTGGASRADLQLDEGMLALHGAGDAPALRARKFNTAS